MNICKHYIIRILTIKTVFFSICFYLFFPTQKIIADSTDIFNLQTIIINSDFKSAEINHAIKIWETPQKLKPEEFIELTVKNKIEKAPNTTLQGFSFNYFWIAFSLKNKSKQTKNIFIEIDNPHIDTISFYTYNKLTNSYVQTGYAGDMMPFLNRTVLNRRFIFPIKLKKNEQQSFLLMVDKQHTSVSFPLKIWDKNEFSKKESISNLLFFLYFGSLSVIIVLTIIIGLLFKNRILITYAIYVVIMGLFIFVSLGFAFQFIYPHYEFINEKIRFPFSVILIIIFSEFSIAFIGIKEYSKKIRQIFYFIYAISLLNLIIWSIFHDYMLNFPGLLVSIQYGIILFSFFLITYSLTKNYKYNKQKTISYILAMSALIIGFIFHLLIQYGYWEQATIHMPPLMIGSGVEILIFTIAIILELKKINDKKNELSLVVAENQKKITAAFIKGAEQEGNRISQELHDNIGSRLALLKNKITGSNSSRTDLQNDLNTIYNDVRKLSHELSPNILQIAGFKSTIEQFLLDFKNTSGINTNLSYHKVPDLRENTKLQLFRVIQESAQNCLKHSNATKLDIQIIGHENELILTIDDNGNGFDTSAPNAISGNGINNMKTRIESINGSFEFSSTSNMGTYLLINIPI